MIETFHVIEYLLHFQTITSRLSKEAIQSKLGPLESETVRTVKIQTSMRSPGESPVLFSLRYNQINDGWKLPYSNMSRALSYEKWLCPLATGGAPHDVTLREVFSKFNSEKDFLNPLSLSPFLDGLK